MAKKRRPPPVPPRARAAGPGDQPTAQRLAHGAEFARTREGLGRLDNALDGLLRTGSLAEAHLQAAERWLRDYAVGEGRPGIADLSGAGGGAYDGQERAMLARVEAQEGVRLARHAVGSAGHAMLVAVMVDNLSLRGLVRARGEHAQYWRGRLEAVCELLVEHYERRDRERRPVARQVGAVVVT